MQGGVIGGICLIACLLTGVRSEESDIPKQLEETNNIGKELSVEDVDSTKLKVTFNDLNITQDGNHHPATGAITLSDQASNDETLPSYSHNSITSSEESRRDTNVISDDKQTRNVDGSQSIENMNVYPYSPPGKSDSSETNDLRSGAPNYTPFENMGVNSAQAYAGALSNSFLHKNQGLNPYTYGYPPGPDTNVGNLASANAFAQVSSGIASAQSSAIVIEDAQSRVVWPNELIFPSKIHGSENTIKCNKENELYHFWSRSFECLVCVCLNIYGFLEPACVKCSGCHHHTPSHIPNFMEQSPPLPPESFLPPPLPEPIVPVPLPNVEPYSPSAPAPSLVVQPIDEPDVQTTQHPPINEVKATCSPLPIGRPYTNPLHPCQICTCTELVNEFGAVDVIIQCKDNLECVLPTDVTTLPPIPDIPVPVPLPLCEKFPHHVPFPHPTERCKVCKCSLEVSQTGALEEQITCYHDTECDKNRKNTTSTETATPPAPPIPIPVEPYAGPVPEPSLEPIPENISVPNKPPIRERPNTAEDPLPWPPISTPAPPPKPFLPKKGPLPGPSPHDSCRPYPPNQPFQHPWDDCQICQCTVIKAIGVVNVEITCYTKPSCCIESPEQAISAIAENGIVENEDNQALQSSYLSSSVKPPIPVRTYAYNPGYAAANAISQNHGVSFNQGYATANDVLQNLGDPFNQGYTSSNAISQNSGNPFNQGYSAANAISQNSGDPFYQGYTAANAISQNSGGLSNQGYAATNTIPYKSRSYLNQGYAPVNAISQKSGNPQNQGYAAANAVSQNSEDSNQGYAVANAISQNSEDSYNQGYAEANVVSQNSGDSAHAVANSLTYNQGDYKLQDFQDQGHAAANAVAQNSDLYNSKYLRSKDSVEAISLAQSDVESLSNQLSGPYQSPRPSLTETNAAYSSQGSFEPYKARIPHKQDYAESNALTQNTINNPLYSGSYNSANAFSSVNGQAVAEADAEYSSLPLLNSYDTGISKNPAYLSSIKTNEKLLSSTYKPLLQYDSYKIDATQNNIYPESIPQNNDRRTNSQKPLQVGQLSPGFSQNQAPAQANVQQSSILTSTFKPPALFNQYNPIISQNPVRATPNAVYKGNISMKDKSQSIYNVYNSGGSQNSLAEAIAQSQDYSLYYQPEASLKPNSNGFPYQSNYYYQNPQLYSSKANTGLKGQYKKIPVKIAGIYDFNGQPEKIYSPQSGLNPYTGYSKTRPTPNLYSSIYPSNYDITPLYRPGQYGSNVQSTAEAYAGSKLQSKSGYTEDSDES